jgi:hypothetical protein
MLVDLLTLFDERALLTAFTVVPGSEVPPAYRDLLVHENHMTVALENHHGGAVEVRVVVEKIDETHYARRSLLALRSTGRIVQHCTMRIDMRVCSEAVRREIREGVTPLGAILIHHNVMRRIEPIAYLKISGAAEIMDVFDRGPETIGYGRVAAIHTAHTPAVELLEIVAPGPGSPTP